MSNYNDAIRELGLNPDDPDHLDKLQGETEDYFDRELTQEDIDILLSDDPTAEQLQAIEDDQRTD